MPPSIMLPDFYRAVWWLQKTAEGGAPGTLADGGPTGTWATSCESC